MKLIVAIGPKYMIGRKGGMPWSCPTDMKRFKGLTMGGVVVMGRYTFNSLRKPLKGRKNVVMTRDPGARIAGAKVVRSLEQLERYLESVKDKDIWVIGGSKVYELLWDKCTEIHVSWINTEYMKDADTFFPDVDWKKLMLVHQESHEDHLYQVFKKEAA